MTLLFPGYSYHSGNISDIVIFGIKMHILTGFHRRKDLPENFRTVIIH